MNDCVGIKGKITRVINFKNKTSDEFVFFNDIVDSGREFLASCIARTSGELPVVVNMLFGDGGTVDGNPKEVDRSQSRLSGIVRLKKAVVPKKNDEEPLVSFSVNILEEEAKGLVFNEMGLELSNGKLLNMATFPDLHFTDQMESIFWSWEIQVV